MARKTIVAPDFSSMIGSPADQELLDLLIAEAQRGDRAASEELLVRSLPRVRKGMRGKVPQGSRGYLDTCDVLQDAAVQTLNRLAHFRPEHEGSMPAFVKRVAGNCVNDEFRRTARRPKNVQLDQDLRSDRPGPLEALLRAEGDRRCRRAFRKLRAKDRQLIIARVEHQQSMKTIACRFGYKTVAAAGMAVRRAQERLRRQLETCSPE